MSDDPSLVAWQHFCRMLEMAGHVVARPSTPDDPLDRAEGVRYLSRLARAGLEAFVEHADPDAPELRRVVSETIKMGADNPDNHYRHAPVHGRHRYRLEGRRGTVRLVSVAVQRGRLGEGAGLPPVGKLDLPLHQEEVCVELGGERGEGAWLPLPEGDGLLLIRQTFGDRARETAASLRLVPLDGAAPAPLTPERLAEGLARAGQMVGGAAAMFAGWVEDFMEQPNTLPRFDPELSTRSGGDPDIAYYHGYWRLGPGEALVVDLEPPPCAYWSFQLNNHWMESLDYRHLPISVNDASAEQHDGWVRIVAAERNPGVANYLSTAGHRQGTMTLRWVRAAHHPDPEVTVRRLEELP